MTRRKIVLLGAGGHASVVADIISQLPGYQLVGAVDPKPESAAVRALGLPILGNDNALPGLIKKGIRLAAIGLGSVGDTSARAALRRKAQALGLVLPSLIHPRAVVASSATLAPGAQVLGGAVINARAALGAGVVVNTGAVIEHDCVLDEDAFIGPRAALGGGVTVETGAFVGLGAAVIQGVRVGARAVVGAGAVVLTDVAPNTTVIGVPAKPRRTK